MSEAKSARESKLAQIRALMARTVNNGCTEAEAKEAAAAVDRLLAKYEIDLDEVTVKEQEIVTLRVRTQGHEIRFGGLQIAMFTDCRYWTENDGLYLVYFGFKVDTEIAEYLTLVFQRAIDRETDHFTMFNADYNSEKPRGQSDMLYSFKVGMAARLGERLGELKSKRDFTRKSSTGTDLVLIKSPLVDAAFDALGMKFGRARGGRAIKDTGAYHAGRKAAEGVAISQGIQGRANVGGRIR
jgi:hypothetical protein